MRTQILFARLLVVSAILLFAGSAVAQSSEAEPRQTISNIKANNGVRLATGPAAPIAAEEGRPRSVTSGIVTRPAPVAPTLNLTTRLDQALLTAIQSHVGASYRFDRTGPDEFDCSGLVWRAFQDVGVNFQRGPARSYWSTFEAPARDEQFKFGTLVFFNNLKHVGIVADEKGFYHSARHGGVMYSTFNEYWLSRIDGFRRVPAQSLKPTMPVNKARTPATNAATFEQNDEP
ncbi:MAG: C40 family peptidase [Pyrinomonadaceae bacterium]